MSKAAAEQWLALLRGRVPPRLVNPEVWPRYSERFEDIIGFPPRPDRPGMNRAGDRAAASEQQDEPGFDRGSPCHQ